MAVPNTLDVVADKLGGFLAGSYREIADVVGDVVDAVWNNHAAGESLEVMVVDLLRRCAVNSSVAFEVSVISFFWVPTLMMGILASMQVPFAVSF